MVPLALQTFHSIHASIAHRQIFVCQLSVIDETQFSQQEEKVTRLFADAIIGVPNNVATTVNEVLQN
jgi:hypothetical protein